MLSSWGFKGVPPLVRGLYLLCVAQVYTSLACLCSPTPSVGWLALAALSGFCHAFTGKIEGVCQVYGVRDVDRHAFVWYLSGLCQENRLDNRSSAFGAGNECVRDVKMVLDEIRSKGQQIQGFATLPVTAQISLLYSEIEAARKLSIPLSAIQAALKEAGSNVSIRYLREALSVVRRRLKESPPPSQARESGSANPPALPTQKRPARPGGRSSKEAQDQKADSYTGSAVNNPLYRHLVGKQE